MSRIKLGPDDAGPAEDVNGDGAAAIRRTSTSVALAELFAGRSPAAWRSEYAGAFEWGADIGREAVEE
jgi:hypothetical protein